MNIHTEWICTKFKEKNSHFSKFQIWELETMDYRYVSTKIWSWFSLSKVYVLFSSKMKPQIKNEYFPFFFSLFWGGGLFQIHLLLKIKMIYIILFTDFFERSLVCSKRSKEGYKNSTQFNFV